jgi:predicted house-cleaning noncanonical NTP pyrophosphatase (MazG superfamily)
LRPGNCALFVESISSHLNSTIGAEAGRALIVRYVRIKRPGNKCRYGPKREEIIPMKKIDVEHLREDVEALTEDLGYMEILELLDVVVEHIADIIGQDYAEVLKRHRKAKQEYLRRLREAFAETISNLPLERLTETVNMITLVILPKKSRMNDIKFKPTIH